MSLLSISLSCCFLNITPCSTLSPTPLLIVKDVSFCCLDSPFFCNVFSTLFTTFRCSVASFGLSFGGLGGGGKDLKGHFVCVCVHHYHPLPPFLPHSFPTRTKTPSNDVKLASRFFVGSTIFFLFFILSFFFRHLSCFSLSKCA